MKIIFLDIDGVVASARDNGFRDLNIHIIHWLRFLCDASGAKIVISSTWRFSHNKVFWQTIFGDLIHEHWATPDGHKKVNGIWMARIRGDEIAEWLAKHPEVESYVILDDDSDFLPEQKLHHIKTDSHNGMLFDHIMALRDKLGVDSFPDCDEPVYQHENMFGATRRLVKGVENP